MSTPEGLHPFKFTVCRKMLPDGSLAILVEAWLRESLIWTPPGDQVIFAWWFAGKGRSLISGLLVQAVSLLALMEFADEVLI